MSVNQAGTHWKSYKKAGQSPALKKLMINRGTLFGGQRFRYGKDLEGGNKTSLPLGVWMSFQEEVTLKQNPGVKGNACGYQLAK